MVGEIGPRRDSSNGFSQLKGRRRRRSAGAGPRGTPKITKIVSSLVAVLLKPATRELSEIQAGLLVSMRNGHACALFRPENLNTNFVGTKGWRPHSSRRLLVEMSTTGLGPSQSEFRRTSSKQLFVWLVAPLSPHDVQFDQSTPEIARQRIQRERGRGQSSIDEPRFGTTGG